MCVMLLLTNDWKIYEISGNGDLGDKFRTTKFITDASTQWIDIADFNVSTLKKMHTYFIYIPPSSGSSNSFTLGSSTTNIFKYDGNTGILSVMNWTNGSQSFDCLIIKGPQHNADVDNLYTDINTNNYIVSNMGGYDYTNGYTNSSLIDDIDSAAFGGSNQIKFGVEAPVGGAEINNTSTEVELIKIHEGSNFWKPSQASFDNLKPLLTGTGPSSKGIQISTLYIQDNANYKIEFVNISA